MYPRPPLFSHIGVIIGNILIAGVSLWVDADVLRTIPVWAWPFVTICPLWPLVLAVFWLLPDMRRKTWAPYVCIPSLTYGVLAPLYYSQFMAVNGFNLRDIGQIIWVWLYAGQAAWIIRHTKPVITPLIMSSVFIIFSLTIQLAYPEFEYLDFSHLTQKGRYALYGIACLTSIALSAGWALKTSYAQSSERT